ncbi:uncharacterized protein LOC133206165 [Saccostrea echinata]|uniref:uncharacterized protein LOC133206165 n=1 Tax=Saccostrea echinata TaxID=191078 RepID=UPI002A7F0C04|nr:uncharacterized protein LOC133206165 [Saccostrea echinata]
MKFKTVLEGQQAVVFNYLGEGRLIKGPQRVFLYRERLQYLKKHTADPYQYIVVKDKDGLVQHTPGPCFLFNNPLLYESVTVKESTKIDANHLIVVYKRLKDSDVQRRIVQGPTVFVPEAEEWIHTFTWHGTDPQNKARMIPGHNTFQKLAVIPDQFYYNVRDVRTQDDTMITVKLMLFYELKDVTKMLNTTTDPIADMMNAVCADVIAFAGKVSFEEFLSKTQNLSDLSTYPQLVQRAEKIGYVIQKVVYRGYHASDNLQMMQNSAIESRTQLRLESEIEEQKSKLENFKLSKEQERTKLVHDMEKAKQDHKQKIAELEQEHKLELREMEHHKMLETSSLFTKAKLDLSTAEKAWECEFLKNLDDLNVNLTDYLVTQNGPPVAEEIRVVNTEANGTKL